MNKYVKEYLHRGLLFSGLGPVTAGIVCFILDRCSVTVALNGLDILKAVLATYVIAFVHAGSSVFPQIETWSRMKAILFQGTSIYVVYLAGYLINNWIPLNPIAIGIYTGGFVLAFGLTWLIVVLVSKNVAKRMNEKLQQAKLREE